jgi:hypothetical protein
MAADPMPVGQATAAPASGAAPVLRLADLVPGQVLQGTVTALLADGRYRLGLLGALVDARADLPLELGRSYWLSVSAVVPELVLRALPPASPAPLLAAGQELLGMPGRELAALLESFFAATPDSAAGGRRERAGPESPVQAALARLAAGRATAADLGAIDRRLGHDQEARVLRLPPGPDAGPEAAVLRESIKAAALGVAAEPSPPESRARAAAALAQGLNGVERENAQRAEQRAPIWIALPAPVGGFLRDARMFAISDREPEAAPARGGAGSFRIVLLLELTRLGALRVDVELQGDRLRARFQAVEPSALPVLREGLPQLEQRLREHGLAPAPFELLLAADGRLPVADLILPRPADASAIVDLHA